MLAIARGFMARPKLLLLDEPSLGLSPALVSDIFEIITRLNREQGVAIVLVTHEESVARAAHRILRFRDGEIYGDERA